MTYVAQEGGDHYQSIYQHWDWVTDIGMGYLAGNATKYITRWRKKNGLQDLLKARTYLEKMIASWDTMNRFTSDPPPNVDELNARFIKSNNLEFHSIEAQICFRLSDLYRKSKISVVVVCLEMLNELIGQATGQGQALPATTLAATPGEGTTAPADGRFLASQGQAIPHRASVDGMEHPFGYDDWHEGSPVKTGFSSVNITKTDEGYNG